MSYQEVVSIWDKNITSWISEAKQHEETIAIEQGQNGRVDYQIDEITYAKGGYSKCVYMRKSGKRAWKIGREIRTY